jgi:hypothetical protein
MQPKQVDTLRLYSVETKAIQRQTSLFLTVAQGRRTLTYALFQPSIRSGIDDALMVSVCATDNDDNPSTTPLITCLLLPLVVVTWCAKSSAYGFLLSEYNK